VRTAEIVDRLFSHRRLVIVVLLLVTVGFGAGGTLLEETNSVGFQTDSTEAEKLDYIQDNFSAEENTTTAQVIVQDENVLDRESLIETLTYQRELRTSDQVNATLTENPMAGVANAVAVASIKQERATALRERRTTLNRTEAELSAALDRLRANPDHSIQAEFERVRANTSVEFSDEQFQTFAAAAETLRAGGNESAVSAAYRRGTRGVLAPEYETLAEQRRQLANGGQPSLAEQREQLESMSAGAVANTVESVLESDNQQLLALMPRSYEPGQTEAEATALAITQNTGGEVVTPSAAPESIIDAQFEMRTLGEDSPGEYTVFGYGITASEIDSSLNDSLAVVGPLAMLFVLTVLLVAYRDPIDVALGLFGIVAVLIWTLGFMGLAGIKFGLIFIAVPVLLIGLSIDYAIHVVMRGREARSGTERTVAEAMTAGIAGVALALVLVTVTAAIGFLSNIVSPITPIQEFGIVNAVGIVSALFIFGLLVPALKVEIDSALETRGWDRQKRAFGTSGRLEPLMRTSEMLARKSPAVLLVVVLLVSTGAAYGGSQLDSSFDTDQFMADEPPAWTDNLPESLEPADYTASNIIDYLDETFLRQEMQVQILVEGDPTSEQFLQQTASGEQRTANAESITSLANGEPAVRGPVSVMEQVAAQNETFNQTFSNADTDGDGVPDQDIEQVYDAFFATDQQAAADVIHRTDSGEYEAARIVAFGDGELTRGEISEEMQGIAGSIERADVTATATGQQTVLNYIIEQEILDTVVQSLLVTLLVVALLLGVIYRYTAGSAMLGLVTTVPVVLALTWVLGTMYLVGISLNSITGMITSLTIGLGVAYSIHVTQRYHQQLEHSESVWSALRTTVTGTGGALLGSAATTAGGFGVLMLSFVGSLQQFGFITAISIVYAFVASVVVLPTLLVLWTRFFGPDWARTELQSGSGVASRSADVADDD
jgi:predicted RND superfamily exporter protein